jgi:hypothetical protein
VPAAVEHNARSVQQLCLPLRNLIRMDIKMLRQLRNGLLSLDGRQRDFRFEYRCVIPAGVFLASLSPDCMANNMTHIRLRIHL